MNDAVTDAYYALKPVRYGILEFLSFRNSLEANQVNDLEIVIQLRSEAHAGFLDLKFKGARDIHVGSLDGPQGGCLIDIRCIKDDQLEGLNYRVIENENLTFSFLCREFLVKLRD